MALKDYARKQAQEKEPITVGIPRAFLYYRNGTLWREYFRTLGVHLVISQPTNRKIEEDGMKAAIDEMCLAMKIYLGHVKSLIGKCDYILIPRVVDFGIRRVYCTSFEGLPDIARNVFRNENIQILSYNVNVQGKKDEESAMILMARELGFSAREGKNAYRAGRKAADREFASKVKAAEALYRRNGLRVAVGAHSYIAEDDYIGKPVIDMLKKMNVIPIRADFVDRKKARERANEISPTLKWDFSREIAGGIAMHMKQIDGIILLSAYPCALDSMVDDMIVRKAEGTRIPILQLTLDAQTGTAGVETRLESFIDILRMNRGASGQELSREKEEELIEAMDAGKTQGEGAEA
ncbi:MAG: acyl-CoA dehydratase activase-related protein [Eubacteriales bacterium]|nr:acyl-CoA dehydratase activase-related protein [Eubacteriales bacterium]